MPILISFIATYLVFGTLGFVLSRKFKRPVNVSIWVALAILTVLSQWILPGTRVVSFFEYEMFANYILQATFAGILVGLAYREIRTKMKAG
jgi:hypothetical protein